MKKQNLLELLILAQLAAIMFALKMAMEPLPNLEPVSLLIIVYTLVFGRKALYAIYTYVGLELLVWGIGLWNLNYLYVWLILHLLTRAFRRMESRLGWAVLSGAFGLGFGLLCFPVYAAAGGWAYGVSSWISGIPYDLMHCVGNFAITFCLQKPLTQVLEKLKAQFLSMK